MTVYLFHEWYSERSNFIVSEQKAAMSIRALPKPVFVEQQEPEPFIPEVIPKNARDAEADANEEIPDLPDPDVEDVSLLSIRTLPKPDYVEQQEPDPFKPEIIPKNASDADADADADASEEIPDLPPPDTEDVSLLSYH